MWSRESMYFVYDSFFTFIVIFLLMGSSLFTSILSVWIRVDRHSLYALLVAFFHQGVHYGLGLSLGSEFLLGAKSSLLAFIIEVQKILYASSAKLASLSLVSVSDFLYNFIPFVPFFVCKFPVRVWCVWGGGYVEVNIDNDGQVLTTPEGAGVDSH